MTQPHGHDETPENKANRPQTAPKTAIRMAKAIPLLPAELKPKRRRTKRRYIPRPVVHDPLGSIYAELLRKKREANNGK
jgi:hypothetical protein